MKEVTAVVVGVIIALGPAAGSAFAGFDEENPFALAAGDADGEICPSCGAANVADAVYCYKCGEKFPQRPQDFEFCPYCGEKINPGDRTCPHCGITIARGPVPEKRATWERKMFGFTLGVGADIGDDTDILFPAEFALNFFDHLAFGPEVSWAPGSSRKVVLVGGSVRGYILPYSRGYFIKPYGNFRFGLNNYKDRYGDRQDMVYYGAGGGLDLRITGSPLVIFVSAGVRVRRDAWEIKDTYFTPAAGLRLFL
jgi:ribosomal protein L40E